MTANIKVNDLMFCYLILYNIYIKLIDYILGIMEDVGAIFTTHHHSDFYLDIGQGHRLFNLHDLVDLSSLKNLSHFAK